MLSLFKMEKKLNAKLIIKKIEANRVMLKKYGVKRIGLFGSFIRGDQNKKSDIDFLVEFNKDTFDNYMDTKFFLERLFRKKIDLVIERNLKKELTYVKEEAVYAKRL